MSRASARLLVAVAFALAAAVATGILLVDGHARSARMIDAAKGARDTHEATMDQQRALDRFLLAGDRTAAVRAAAAAAASRAEANERLDAAIAGDERLAALAIDLHVARSRWVDGVSRAVMGARPAGAELDAFLDRDDDLFARYRSSYEDLSEAVLGERDGAVRDQRRLLLAGIASQLGLLLVVGGFALRNRRTLVRDVVGPVDAISGAVGRMRDGDLDARVPGGPHVELATVADGLGLLGSALADERARAERRAAHIAAQADRFRQLLRMNREIAGNLNLRYVVDAVVAAARRLTGWDTAVVHLVDDGALEGDLLVVAATGEPLVVDGRVAFPMVVGGTVIGVLECRGAGALPDDVDEVLAVLASQAATAVEAARLHGRLQHESRMDALTGLANRRVFDEDLHDELARAQRYGRPLAVVLLDLDHFKTVNDTYGHQRGDAVLQDVARTMLAQLRTTDSAYRYGGEELVLLLRETDLDAAAAVAERFRADLERSGPDGVPLTASFGVAQVGCDEAGADVIARADAALYEAKAAGRNRVVPSQSPAAGTVTVKVAPDPRAASIAN